MKLLPSKIVVQFLLDNMTFDDYDFNEMYSLYTRIMGRDKFLEFKVMGRDSLRKRLQEWSDVPGGLLGRKGTRADTIYFKSEPAKGRCIDFSRVKEFLERGKRLWK